MLKTQLFPKQTGKTFGSASLRFFFLLLFTKELIKHSATTDVLKLKIILKEEKKKKLPSIIKEKIKTKSKLKEIKLEKEYFPSILKFQKEKTIPPQKLPVFNLFPKQSTIAPLKKKIFGKLRIPETRLPLRLQYIKPIPTQREIDLEKLNPLIRDPMVKTIECNGPDETVIVAVGTSRKKTNIILNKEEINQTIKKFSGATQIPIQEGIFRVAIGKLILSAIISEVSNPRFIIRKMRALPSPPGPTKQF